MTNLDILKYLEGELRGVVTTVKIMKVAGAKKDRRQVVAFRRLGNIFYNLSTKLKEENRT